MSRLVVLPAALMVLLAGCDTGRQAQLYHAEKALWRIAKRQEAISALPPEIRHERQLELAEAHRGLAAELPAPDPTRTAKPDDPTLTRLYRLRAAAQLEGARWLIAAGRDSTALEMIERTCREYTWNPRVTAEAYRNRFLLLERMGDPRAYAQAVEEMLAAVDLSAPGVEPPAPLLQSLRRSARLFQVHGDPDRAGIQRQAAREELKRLLARGLTGSPRILAHTELALLALEGNNTGEALEHYQAALDMSRGTQWEPSLRFALANFHLGDPGQPEEAVEGFKQLARRHPESPLSARGLLMAGATLRSMGAYEEARRVLAWADSLAARDRELHASIVFEQGLVEEDRGDWSSALSLYRQAAVDAPRSRAALNAPLQIAQHHLRDGDRQAAESVLRRSIRDYDRLIEQEEESQVVLLAMEMRSQARILLEDWPAAVEGLLELARRAPRSEFAPLALAEAARLSEQKLERPEQTRQIWRRLLERYPGTPLAAIAARELEAETRP
ncbi:MAG: tetratricopeptide repeat protein [Candidatus Eisenbacteria bacterium]|nr:tetratricopeptide repeat protein [Candidatus Eisenbacteria bacterium]